MIDFKWLMHIQGKVPKNDFGNIDLYVSSMLPKGAAHVPCELSFKLSIHCAFR
jgi:xeroderma pigmentosum group C-complementing protein